MKTKPSKISARAKGSIFEVSGTNDAGLHVYYYIFVDKLKEALFLKADGGNIDIHNFGTVLYAGLGFPSEAARERALALAKEA